MQLISYLHPTEERDQLAILVNNIVYDTQALDPQLPDNMGEFLLAEDDAMLLAKGYDARLKDGQQVNGVVGKALSAVALMAPIPYPNSLRDAYAFRQHVAAGRRNRGLDMIPEFDQFPVFYFSNHSAIYGPGQISVMPDHLHKLDFELEWACVIGIAGTNIRAEEADEFIAGFTIMNDFSARHLQMLEMKLNLGPAKGKDFATAIGPSLITPDELQSHLCPPPEGHIGNAYDLEMTCHVNGKLVSQGNTKDMSYTFAEIIERASYGIELLPGDIIGSGTVGTGCFLELNGTARHQNGDNAKQQWLQAQDEISLSIEKFGSLSNTIVKSTDKFSIL